MNELFNKIKELKDESLRSKHEQLVTGIINAINDKDLKKGDRLPSINNMVKEVGFARKTIVRAYEDLKGRGIVESKNFKGYYIANINTKSKLKIALLLYAFQAFHEDFYNTFRKELGKKYQIDIFFHHNNLEVFKNIIDTVNGKYGMYVIAPIPVPEVGVMLRQIPSEKLLIIDRYIEMPQEYSFISQEFENSTYQRLQELYDGIKKYDKMILFYRSDSDYPEGIKNGFTRFIDDYSINGSIQKTHKQGSVKKNTLYFFISDTNLWQVLKDTVQEGYKLGEDVGIITHNDSDAKEIIFNGITTISADFKEMAIEAAAFVKDKIAVHKIIPSQIKKRNSL
ncbi:MAG: GntR family transcriptional regulator [Cellulophaga sp.]|uniref:GntR family transcriptional regulator n=1 Tax=Cellulophaga sp. TaxID=1972202 RepID=UPI003264FAD6